MLSEEIDFYQIFKVHPTAMALLTPDLEVIDANDEFLEAAGHPLEDVLGKNAFTVFGKRPDSGGDAEWTALEEAQSTGHRTGESLTRFDVEDPASPGVFQERYWSTSITPVHGPGGDVEVLEFSAREVTPIIRQFKELGEHEDA